MQSCRNYLPQHRWKGKRIYLYEITWIISIKILDKLTINHAGGDGKWKNTFEKGEISMLEVSELLLSTTLVTLPHLFHMPYW